jgi:hypothetical protein
MQYLIEPGKTCSHGIPWHEDCPQCALVSARETVRHWGEMTRISES